MEVDPVVQWCLQAVRLSWSLYVDPLLGQTLWWVYDDGQSVVQGVWELVLIPSPEKQYNCFPRGLLVLLSHWADLGCKANVKSDRKIQLTYSFKPPRTYSGRENWRQQATWLRGLDKMYSSENLAFGKTIDPELHRNEIWIYFWFIKSWFLEQKRSKI